MRIVFTEDALTLVTFDKKMAAAARSIGTVVAKV